MEKMDTQNLITEEPPSDLSSCENSTNLSINLPENENSLNNLINLSSTTSVQSDRPYYKLISVEPVVLLFSFAITLTYPVNTSLYLVHTCIGVLGYNESFCSKLEHKSSKDLEELVQPTANIYIMLVEMVETCIPAILTLFVGPWSDTFGRKTFLITPILGYSLKYLMCLGFSFFPGLHPGYLLFSSIPVSLAGGLISTISQAYCYITDISKEGNRGFRMGILEACFYTGLLIGTISSTYIFSAAGYLGVYGTSSTLCILALIYGIFIVSESVPNVPSSCCICELFDFKLVKEMFRACCKQRSDGKRAVIALIVIAISTFVLTMVGEGSVQFLFTRAKFNWDIKHFTTFGSINLLAQIVGTVFVVTVLSSILKISDGALAASGILLKVASSVLLAISLIDWWMYLGALVGMFGAVAGPLCRSILSKTVDPQDVGKVFSLLTSMEAITPLAAAPLYTLIYNTTILTFPGAFYLLSAAIFLIDFILLSAVVYILQVVASGGYSAIGG